MEKIRLQKFIADSGLMSRRAAEGEIEQGNFSVNGHVAIIGMKIDPAKDTVTYKGKRIKYEKREHTYIMLNKPRGYLCSTNDDRGRKCVTDLLEGVKARVYPEGRNKAYDTAIQSAKATGYDKSHSAREYVRNGYAEQLILLKRN